jgi:hypothetical protein
VTKQLDTSVGQAALRKSATSSNILVYSGGG